MNNITRDYLLSIDLGQISIASDIGLERQSLLEAFDDIAGMKLLSEANNCVEQQKAADDAEVNPVLQTSSQKSRALFKACWSAFAAGATAFVM